MNKLKFDLAAFVVRDWSGSIVDGPTSSFSFSFPVLAEARAVWDAIVFAQWSTNVSIIIESDCKEVIDVISGQASFLP